MLELITDSEITDLLPARDVNVFVNTESPMVFCGVLEGVLYATVEGSETIYAVPDELIHDEGFAVQADNQGDLGTTLQEEEGSMVVEYGGKYYQRCGVDSYTYYDISGGTITVPEPPPEEPVA